MRLEPGHHLLRFELVSAANLGTTEGTAAVDRPTALDPELGLPYLPDSALKGVFAGRWGNVDEADPRNSRERERLWGSPDRPGQREAETSWGRPSPNVVGNGELVCFPMVGAGGKLVRVAAARSLARLLRLEGRPEPGLVRVLGELDRRSAGAIALPDPAELEVPARIEWQTGRQARAQAPAAAALTGRYSGHPPTENEPLVVVSRDLARRLWRHASELRTLTSLEPSGKTVRAGSLRFVELVPAGAIFVSKVSSWLRGVGPELPEHIQVGGWEAQGLGWARVSQVEASGPCPEDADDAEDGAAPKEARRSGSPSPRSPREPQVMVAMHQAIEELRGADPKLRGAIRAAVKNFGPRAQFSGLERAIAFSLDKSRPAHPEPRREAKAHRWLLEAVLLGETARGADKQPAHSAPPRHLLDWLGEEPFEGPRLARQRETTMLRWRWLRRFAELGLADDGSEAGTGGSP